MMCLPPEREPKDRSQGQRLESNKSLTGEKLIHTSSNLLKLDESAALAFQMVEHSCQSLKLFRTPVSWTVIDTLLMNR